MDVISYIFGHKAGENAAFGSVLIGITEQPENFSGALGETASFSVKALGENLKYQWEWYYNSGWRNTTAEGNKTDTITMEITAARDGNQYRCVVTSNGGTITSNAATLTVSE